MTAKAYLSQAKQQDVRIGALLDRQRRYHELAAWRPSVGSVPNVGSVPSVGSEPNAGESRGSARMIALEKELDARIERYAELVREIEGVIDAVEDAQYRDVLRYRYLNGWTWKRIAERMHFSQDWVWRLHARAMRQVKVPGADGM